MYVWPANASHESALVIAVGVVPRLYVFAHSSSVVRPLLLPLQVEPPEAICTAKMAGLLELSVPPKYRLVPSLTTGEVMDLTVTLPLGAPVGNGFFQTLPVPGNDSDVPLSMSLKM